MGFKRAAGAALSLNDDVIVDGLSHDGRGIARHKGKTLFVAGALPGETVRVRVLEDKRRFMNTQVVHVLAPSPERCQPACRYFDQCGGCSLQYWSHEGQLTGKEQIVLDQLRRFASVAPQQMASPLLSPPYGYRYRCRFALRWRKGQLQFGLRQKASNAICDIDHCPVLAEPLQEIPRLLKSLLPTLTNREAISHAESFLADNGRAVLLRHLRPLSKDDRQRLLDFALAHKLFLYLQGSPECIELLSPDTNGLYYGLGDLKLYFRPQDFTQVNWLINQKMVGQALDWLALKPTDKVLDLFCGLGNFSLPMARKCHHVTGVEGSQSSVDQARHNATANGLNNVSFYCTNLAGDFARQLWAQECYDIALLDPPRAGADFMIARLAGSLPPRLLYISCNPATLARDTQALLVQGYKLHRLGVIDMFPQTAHVESMALFSK